MRVNRGKVERGNRFVRWINFCFGNSTCYVRVRVYDYVDLNAFRRRCCWFILHIQWVEEKVVLMDILWRHANWHSTRLCGVYVSDFSLLWNRQLLCDNVEQKSVNFFNIEDFQWGTWKPTNLFEQMGILCYKSEHFVLEGVKTVSKAEFCQWNPFTASFYDVIFFYSI